MNNTLFDDLNYQNKTIREGIDLNTMEFKPLKDFIGQTVSVDGFFYTNGKYGEQVVVVGNGAKINIPSRFVEKFKRIEQNADKLEGMMNGHLVLKDIEPVTSRNGSTVGFTFGFKE